MKKRKRFFKRNLFERNKKLKNKGYNRKNVLVDNDSKFYMQKVKNIIIKLIRNHNINIFKNLISFTKFN